MYILSDNCYSLITVIVIANYQEQPLNKMNVKISRTL